MQQDFRTLQDGDQLSVMPEVLLDFKYGNIRSDRDEKVEHEITESIKKRGIIQPVTARPHPDYPNKLELIAGFGRRDKAMLINTERKSAGDNTNLMKVPVLIKCVDDIEAQAIQVCENTQRQNLSLLEESAAAQKYMTRFGGDRDAAAVELGWTKRKLDERLELQKCTDKVLDQLRKGHISAGHAITLAPFPAHVQDAQIDNVVANNITVTALRNLVGKVQLSIADARFDTTECMTCPHNSAPQLGLFGGTDTSAKCANRKCYMEKKQEWLNGIKDEAEEKYGTVLFLSETSDSEVNTISPEVVGKAQFEEGCANCEKHVAIMEDAEGKEGLIREHQCINTKCFTEKAAPESILNYGANEQGVESDTNEIGTADTAVSVKQSTTRGTSAKPKTKKTPGADTISAAVQANHKTILAQAASTHYVNNPHYKVAVALAALVEKTRYSGPEGDAVIFTMKDFKSVLLQALSMDVQAIQKHMQGAINHMITNTVAYEDILIKSLAHDKANAESVARSAWEPTEANLKSYTTKQLQQLAKNAGYDKAMEAEKAGTWKKAANGNKADLIKAIVKVGHVSPQFAPSEYLKHVMPE